MVQVVYVQKLSVIQFNLGFYKKCQGSLSGMDEGKAGPVCNTVHVILTRTLVFRHSI